MNTVKKAKVKLISVSGLGLEWEIGDEDFTEELHEITANLMLLVVLVHIAGVLISSVLHRENLVRAMFTGYKQSATAVGITRAHVGLGVVLLLAIVGFLGWYLM